MALLPLVAALSVLAPAFASGSLGAELTLEVGQGQSVALLPSGKGLLAISADGSRQRPITSGAVTGVLVDDRAGVAWFERAGALWLVDLELPRAQPERVARNIGDQLVTIAYGTDASELLQHRTSTYDGAVQLVLAASPPQFQYDEGIYDSIFEDQAKESAKRAAGVRWEAGMRERVHSIAARAAARRLFVPELSASQRVPQVPPGGCEDPELCGMAEPIGATPFLYVTVAHECGDACHVARQFYDTRSRQFFDPRDPKRRGVKPLETGGFSDLEAPEDLWIAPRGEGFVSRGVLYHFERGRLSGASSGVRGGGWIGSQWYVE